MSTYRGTIITIGSWLMGPFIYMKKTGEDLSSNYGKIEKKLLLLARAVKTALLTPSPITPASL